jgi:hypothetical protein
VRDGHILESNVELSGATGELRADLLGDGFSLGDEFGGVELGDDGLEDLVTDGGEDSLIVVDTEILVFVSPPCKQSRSVLFAVGGIHTW